MRSLNRNSERECSRGGNLFKNLLYILPLCLFFSYYPVISFGSSETMNFELSVPLLWLVGFDAVILVMGVRQKMFWKGIVKRWMWLLLPVWLSVSVLWSLNPVRGILTAGILWLIYMAVYGMWYFRGMLVAEDKMVWWKWFFGATLVACAWCVVQCALDLAGVGREYGLMCAGCTYQMFGFPHPNGFAIEPQFMGNLLLAPVIVTAWMVVQGNWNDAFRGRVARSRRHGARALILGRNLRKPLKTSSPIAHALGSSSVPVVKTTTGSRFLGFEFLLFCFFMISATLFLTFSRGAIYAFGVGMVFMSAFVMVRERERRKGVLKRLGIVWGTVAVAFVVTLNVQGVMSAVSPTSDTYVDGVAKALHHLSLGVVDVRNRTVDSQPEEVEVVEDEVVENFVENSEENEAVFDGYVAESTDTRLRLTGVAMEAWSKSPQTVLLGVGLGGAGQALYNDGLSPSPKEIVQNEYASLLLETGLIGIGLLMLTILLVVRAVIRWRKASGMILALLVAYGVTLMFFSGLPNALQIYLLPGVLMVMLSEKCDRHKSARLL